MSADHPTQLAVTLSELKKHGLLSRVSCIEVADRGISVQLGSPPGEKLNTAKEKLEQAQLDDEIMYASSGSG